MDLDKIPRANFSALPEDVNSGYLTLINDDDILVAAKSYPVTIYKTSQVGQATGTSYELEITDPSGSVAPLQTLSSENGINDIYLSGVEGIYKLKLNVYKDGSNLLSTKTFYVKYTRPADSQQSPANGSFSASIDGPDSGVVGQQITFKVDVQTDSDQEIDGAEFDIQRDDKADPGKWGCDSQVNDDTKECMWFSNPSGKKDSFSKSWTPTAAGTYRVYVGNIDYGGGKSGCQVEACGAGAVKTVTVTEAGQQPPSQACTPGTPKFVDNSCTGRCKVAGCQDGEGEGKVDYLQADCQTYTNRQSVCVADCGNQCSQDPPDININNAPDCDYSEACGDNGVKTCKGKMLSNKCTYVEGFTTCDNCILPQVCSPGSYNVDCTGNCGSCGEGSGTGEAAVQQCSSDGSGWEDRNPECNPKCSAACGGSGPTNGEPCTYPEGCSGGGAHVCHGSYQGGVCRYDSGVDPDCSQCSNNIYQGGK